MNNTKEVLQQLTDGKFDDLFALLYGKNAVKEQRNRYIEAVHEFTVLYGEQRDLRLFSAPGRTEIGGNHTDHNRGCVLAGSVNLDVIAVVAPAQIGQIRVKSKGYAMDTVSLDILEPKDAEKGHSISLIRGTAARFSQLNYQIGGFNAYTTSDVLAGSGLSSSAAFEVLIGTILNGLFNDDRISAVEIAQIAQYAENVFFGKPCGLMDQMASSVGGIISIDFADPEKPVIESVPFDFAAQHHRLCIVDVGGNHADLTDEYAAVPNEMKAVAKALGVSYLRETSFDALFDALPAVRKACGDRAVLRAMHFFAENERVANQVAALKNNDFGAFLSLIKESGHSSFEYLQNVYPVCDVTHQGMSLALSLSQHLLGEQGAFRVHGGGFGGTTQNFVPENLAGAFEKTMNAVFGEGHCHSLSIRPRGAVNLTKEVL